MEHHPAELAFHKQYEDLLLARKITAVFRPGVRVPPSRNAFVVGQAITARVIERHTPDRVGLPPVFNDLCIPLEVTRLEVMTIDGLTPEDFEGFLPDVCDGASLRKHLAALPGEPADRSSNAITRIQFRYMPQCRIPHVYAG
jgi:hypothetical protein